MVTHQGFADEDGIGPGIENPLGVFGGFEARFGNKDHVVGSFLGQTLSGGKVGGEAIIGGLEVRL